MALSSSSTFADALAQYNDNLSWEGSPAKAVLALEALRWLLVNRPQSNSVAGRSVNYAAFEEEKKLVEAYVARCGATSYAARSPFTRGVPKCRD